MNLESSALMELVGGLVGFFLTIMVFSYILGDNPFFRVAINIFIGAAAGYALVVAWYSVIWPQLLLPLIFGSQSERLFVLFPLLFAGLLLLKMSSRLSWLGSPAVAYLVGVGAATAVGGAVLGTILPQVSAAVNALDWDPTAQGAGTAWLQVAAGILLLIGTTSTLAYFHFGARPGLGGIPRRSPWLEIVALVGKGFIAVTLGAIFAGAFLAAFAALVERIEFFREFLVPLILSG
jgi:hypothetical protein